MKKIIFIILIVALFGCNAEKRLQKRCAKCPTKETIIKKDSVVYSVHDSIIKIPADSSVFEATIKCDSTNRALLQEINVLSSKGVKTVVYYKDNIIKVKTTINEDSLRIAIMNKYHLVSNSENKVIEKQVIVHKLTFKQWCYYILFLVVVFVLGMVFKKPIMFLFKALINKF